MNYSTQKISAIPTNIITGFLGTGKTSAILHLLKSKPVEERWAVLVNEFGEIGIDGELIQGQKSQSINTPRSTFIREVPGGCMCCTAGLPMKVALNQLLQEAKPDRVLIEPTGLGHPQEVLDSLTSDTYSNVLDLQNIITLVDARKLADERYTTHATFNQQIAIADVVIGNKSDLYTSDEEDQLKAYIREKGAPSAHVLFTQNGQINLAILSGDTQAAVHNHELHTHEHENNHNHDHNDHHHHSHDHAITLAADLPFPDSGYIKAINSGEGFESIGWRFSSKHKFNHEKLTAFLQTIISIDEDNTSNDSKLTIAERVKATIITHTGNFGYNLIADDLQMTQLHPIQLTSTQLYSCKESRLEIIAQGLDNHVKDNWEKQLLSCITEQ